MAILNLVCRLAAAAAFLAVSALAVFAQDTQRTPMAPQTPPAAATTPAPQTNPTTPQTNPTTMPSTKPASPDRAANAKQDSLVGLTVFSSDGNRLGTVHSVNTEPGGKVKAIHIKTGGFLGFGGKLVAIPEGKFVKSGDNIQLGISADEVKKMPEVKEQS